DLRDLCGRRPGRTRGLSGRALVLGKAGHPVPGASSQRLNWKPSVYLGEANGNKTEAVRTLDVRRPLLSDRMRNWDAITGITRAGAAINFRCKHPADL